MKKLDTSFISSTAFQPVKQGTLDLLQQAHQETTDALVKALIGSSYDATKYYILNGCVATGTNPGARTVTAGAVFFAGEVYLVDAFSGTTTGSNVLVCTVATTFVAAANADPVLFTDGSSNNVHQIRKLVVSIGASASADVDFSDIIPLEWVASNDTSGVTVTAGSATVTGGVFKYKRVPGGVLMNYGLSVNVSAYSTGLLSITVPLLIPEVPVGGGFGLLAVMTSTGLFITSTSVFSLMEANVVTTSLFLTVRNQSVTGNSVMYGQIFYES